MMAGSLRNDSLDFYSKYYFELKDDSKKRYNDKLKLINCKKDPFKRLESPDTFSGVTTRWHEWPDLMYPDIYNYLILTPSLYTHEQLKSYKSLDGYNQYMNGWVGDIVSTVSTVNRCKIYLFTAFVKHSQSLSLPSLKAWATIKQSG